MKVHFQIFSIVSVSLIALTYTNCTQTRNNLAFEGSGSGRNTYLQVAATGGGTGSGYDGKLSFYAYDREFCQQQGVSSNLRTALLKSETGYLRQVENCRRISDESIDISQLTVIKEGDVVIYDRQLFQVEPKTLSQALDTDNPDEFMIYCESAETKIRITKNLEGYLASSVLTNLSFSDTTLVSDSNMASPLVHYDSVSDSYNLSWKATFQAQTYSASMGVKRSGPNLQDSIANIGFERDSNGATSNQPLSCTVSDKF